MIFKLSVERVRRTYTGGALINRLFGDPCEDSYFPEDWIMSVTTANGSQREGLSTVADGRTLKDLIASDPERLLGRAHFKKYGAATGVLAKLLDSSERLTVQVHPDRLAAQKYFGSPFGKTESWHIIETRSDDACIYLGFREGVTREYWRELFESQDIEGMLSCLNKIQVRAGETYLVRAGEPHAIGAGCLLVEVQEPTDHTLRTERTTPSGLRIGDLMCHGGIGFENMLDCFHYEPKPLDVMLRECRLTPRKNGCETVLIDSSDTPCFGLTRLNVDGGFELEPCESFYGLYVLSGEGSLNGERVTAGDRFFVSACETVKIEGIRLDIARILPPEAK